MAAKRPLRTTSFRGGKIIRHGRAASLPGAVISNTRRMLRDKISAVEITDSNERLLCEIQWSFSYHVVGDKTLLIRFKKGSQRWLKV